MVKFLLGLTLGIFIAEYYKEREEAYAESICNEYESILEELNEPLYRVKGDRKHS